MKQRMGSLVLIACVVLAFSLAGGTVVSAADGDTVSFAPLFTDGTTRADYDVKDDGDQVLAKGFVAGQAYTLTVNMTTVSETGHALVLSIPANYQLDFFTPASNATIAPYMDPRGVINKTNDDGSRTLTYWFNNNATAVGFTVTVRPTLKLNDGDTCSVTAELYRDEEEVSLATASSSVRIYNPAVHPGAFRATNGSLTTTFTPGDPAQPLALSGSVSSNYVGRHAYHSVQVVLPLPDAAAPGYYDGEVFTLLTAGDARELSWNGTAAGSITYHESYASIDASGNDLTIPKALVYELETHHPLSQGTTNSLAFSGLGGLYLQFPADATSGENKTYASSCRAQVNAKITGDSDYVRLLDHAAGNSLRYTYQKYNLSNFFWQSLSYGYDQYCSDNYVLPVEDNQYFCDYFQNSTGETIENIVTEYTFDHQLYVNRLEFSLSSSSGSPLPAVATVVYMTKSGGDTKLSAAMTAASSRLSLSDPTDAFTYLQVTYDKLGSFNGTLLRGYLVNRDRVDSGTYQSVRVRILSATCPTTLVGTGAIGAQPQVSMNFRLQTYFNGTYPRTDLSKTTLNKGDSFAVRVYPTYYYAQQFTDLNVYILMPPEYVYSSFSPFYGYTGPAPAHATKTVVVTSENATAQVPVGSYTLHTFSFPGTFKCNNGAAHSFYFEVGPLVDTATARTNVYLPAAVAMSQTNTMYRYSPYASYQMTDTWDFDGDGDITEKLATSNQHPTVTINAASALSAKSYLTTSYAPGTEAATQSYQYNSTGSYRFYLYNGLASGNNTSDVSIDIFVPRDNGSVTHDSSTYTSSWNAFLTGAPVFADDSGFLAGATVSYSVDGGSTYSTDNPADWGTVTNVRIASAPGQSLADGENVVVTLPFQAGYEGDINLSSKAYFGNTMQYKLTSSGSLAKAISIPPVIMQPANVVISGAVYQDLNGNLTKDPSESGNGTSYPVKLYRLATDGEETLQTSTSSNASTGAYTFSVLQPGDFRIRVTKSTSNQYFPLGAEDSFADDGTCTLSISGGVTGLSDLNLGILIPRTLTLNMSSAKVVDGTPQQIVPSVSSPLTGLEAVTYASSDPGVVAVAADGTLIYVTDGSATVTVSAPQLLAVVAAQGAGASDSVTATVSVVSQDDTCTISNDPYIGSTPSAAKTDAISTASGSYPYSQTFYYLFNRSGYCNAAGHTYAEAVTWSINPTGTTAPGASITKSGANASVSATGVGTVVLMAEETDEHRAATPLTLTVTIDKANIAGVSFSDLRVTYDGNPHGITIDGALPEGATVTYSNSINTNAGVYNATATISGGANYNDLTLNATLTIDRANITGVSFSSLTVPYDGTVKALVLTGTPPAGTSAVYSNHRQTNAGTYSASVTIEGGTNYNSRTLNATLVINRVQLMVTVDNYSRIYGEDNPAFTVSVSGFVNGESAATAAGYTAPTAGTTATAATGVGTAAITLSGGEATNYAFIISDTGLLSIQPKILTIAANDLSKTYGSGYAFAGTELTSVGLVNGDRVASANISSTGALSGAAVGGYDVNISNAIGTGLGNYDIAYIKGTLTVEQKAITVTAKDQSKTYGETLVLGTTQFSTADGALVGSDNITGVTLTSDGAVGSATVGNCDIVASAAVGTGLSNYTISYAKGTLSVGTKALTIAANSASKTYGDALTLTGSEFAASGLVNGDQITSITLTSDGATATAPAGSHDILPSAAVGPRLGNYSISYTKGTLTVNKKPITVTAQSRSKTYGEALALGTTMFSTVEGALAGGDAIAGVTLTSAGAGSAAAVGDYDIIPSAAVGNGLSNYTISYTKGTLNVGAKSLTITANSTSKTYGDGLTFSGNEFAASGLVNGDRVTSVTLASGGAVNTAIVQVYEIVPTAAVGPKLSNYTISYVNGVLTVNQKPITVTAKGQSKTYGERLDLGTAMFSTAEGALVGDDKITGVTLTSDGADGAATVRAYDITPSAADGIGLDNYNISYAAGILTVGKKDLTITAKSASKTYGDALTFTGGEFEVSGLVNGDLVTSVTLASDGAAETAIVKGYDIVPSAAVGPKLGNYTISYVNGALAVGKKPITVTADDRSKTYGDTLLLGTTAFQTAAGALVGSDNITGVTLTSAGAGSTAAAGSYVITPSAATGTGLGNYEISYAPGNLSVGKQTLNVTVNPDQSKVYGQADPTLTYLASGFVNGQDEAILSGVFTRVAGENAGSYAIGQATLSAGDNYSINFTGANFTITKAPLTVTADDKSKVYGAEDPALTYTPSGPLYHGDEYSVISGVTISAPTGANVDAGEHEITISGGEAANYLVTHVAGKLQVTPKTIPVVGILAASKYYDGTNQVHLVTSRAALAGVLPGDDVTLDATAAVGAFDDALLGIGKVVSVTGLALTGADAGNYVLAAYTTTASIVEEEEKKPSVSGVEIIVNGQRHDAATASTTIEDGKTVTTVVVDPAKLSARLEAEGGGAVVTIPVDTGANRVVGELTGQMVKEMEQAVATVQVATERAIYTLPAEQINIDAVADQLGEQVSLRDVKVHVQIAEPNPETVRVVEDQMNRENYLLVVPPVEFSITCTHGDQTVEVSRFNAYVERQIAIPAGVEPGRVTTAVVVEADGTLRHVPTKVIVVDGKYYAQVNSLTNSTYTVIWNPLTYQDMVGHWAKGPVEDMGSRLVMIGDSAEVFGARRDITRGEFAVTIVKALGLQPMNGESLFSDVASDSELSGYALTAAQYGLMGGLPGGIFGPTQSITREEAMSIVVAAMRVSGVQNQLQPAEVEALLAGYADAAQVGAWARNVVADCLQSRLIGGRPGKLIAPKDDLTRAEAAAIVQRLLRRAGLI